MKAGNLLLLSGAGLLIYGAANAFNIKNAVPNLTYSNPRIKLVKKSLVRVHLEITLDISNPGSTDIPLDYFQGKAYYNSKQIASFNFNPQSGTNIFLKGRATTPVTFTVVVSSLNVVQLFLDIIKTVKNGGKLSSGITIDGSLYAAGIDLPVKFTYDFKTNQVSGIGSIGERKLINKLSTYNVSVTETKRFLDILFNKPNHTAWYIHDFINYKLGLRPFSPDVHDINMCIDYFINQAKHYNLIKNNFSIGSVKATLEFGNNREMEKYFTAKRIDRKIIFSKN